MLKKNNQSNFLMAYFVMALAIVVGGGSLCLLGIFLFVGSFTVVDFGLTKPTALVLDGILCLIFFLQHSGMVRRAFQQRFDAVAPRHYRNAIYAIASGAALLLLLLLWQRTDPVVISVQGPLRGCFYAALLVSLVGFLWGVRSLGSFDALGIQPILVKGEDKTLSPMPLTVHGAYRWVRHPLYTSSLLLIWAQPDLTYDRILFNLSWTGWIIVGCFLEERDLLVHFGESYARYQQEVPMLVPWRIPGQH